MKNILTHIKENQVEHDPFPHLVIRDVLEPELINQLVENFPSIDVIAKGQIVGSNQRFDFTVKDVRGSDQIHPIWKEFVEAQASDEFWADFVRLFGAATNHHFSQLKAAGVDLKNLKRGIRYIDNNQNSDFLIDTHISINTPVTSNASSVRTAHVDDPRKIYGGLLYMRPKWDNDSVGGDLVLYRYKGDKKVFQGQHIDEKYLEPVKTIKYENNVLVFFLNTINSLHGVTPRQPTKHPRLFVNLIAEFPNPLFDIKSLQENIWIRRFRKYAKIFGSDI